MSRAGAGPAEDAVAVVRWLREHPDVIAGPSVRASVACAELLTARQAVTGEYDLAAAARTCVGHRLQVTPGTDTDELVRRAVAAVTHPASGTSPEHAAAGEDRGPAPEQASPSITAGTVAAADGSGGEERPQRVEVDHDTPGAVFPEREAHRLVRALADLRLTRRPASGPTSARGAATPSGHAQLAPRPFRRGDRGRDLSVRATVRATAASGRRNAAALRAVDRAPDVALDVVFALDCSGSMEGTEKLARARAACRDLAAELTRSGHRVGLVAFSQQPVIVSRLGRSLRGFSGRATAFEPAHPTDLEAALDAARLLLRREALASSSGHIVVVSDAHPTAQGAAGRETGGTDHSWRQMAGRFGTGRGGGFGVHAARYAALVAAAACRRGGVAVSVLVPSNDSDAGFAARLAAAGGGIVDRLPGDRAARGGHEGGGVSG